MAKPCGPCTFIDANLALNFGKYNLFEICGGYFRGLKLKNQAPTTVLQAVFFIALWPERLIKIGRWETAR